MERVAGKEESDLVEHQSASDGRVSSPVLSLAPSSLKIRSVHITWTLSYVFEVIHHNFLRFITPFNFPHYGLWIIIFLLALIWQVQPLSLGRYICYLEDSFGLVTSIGIFGYEKWIGYLEGQLQYNEANDVGVVGFTGMKIYLGLTYGSIYLGYAHHISIRDWGWFRY